jgi:putative FmdB family regulatory protein
MPIYAYRCDACGHQKDVLQKMSDPTLTVCPSCGAESFARQLSAPAFQLKGTGWYVTDFRDNGKKSNGDSGKAATAGDGDAKTAGDASGAKSDAKPDTKSDSATPAVAPAPAAAPVAGLPHPCPAARTEDRARRPCTPPADRRTSHA